MMTYSRNGVTKNRGGEQLTENDRQALEIQALRERPSGPSETRRRINESLDFDSVL